jgi:hypothetical protein
MIQHCHRLLLSRREDDEENISGTFQPRDFVVSQLLGLCQVRWLCRLFRKELCGKDVMLWQSSLIVYVWSSARMFVDHETPGRAGIRCRTARTILQVALTGSMYLGSVGRGVRDQLLISHRKWVPLNTSVSLSCRFPTKVGAKRIHNHHSAAANTRLWYCSLTSNQLQHHHTRFESLSKHQLKPKNWTT